MDEEGVDEGGLRKEFYQLIINELLDQKYGMFEICNNYHWFTKSLQSELLLEEYKLIGILIGIAIYNGIIIDIHFPTLIYKKLLNISLNLNDLNQLYPDLYQGFQTLLSAQSNDINIKDVYCRTFEISYKNIFNEIITQELIPNGSLISLTNENKYQYISLYQDFLLNKSIAKQFNAFANGYKLLCSNNAFDIFNEHELQLLICGNPVLNFDELQANCIYMNGYNKDSITIKFLVSST